MIYLTSDQHWSHRNILKYCPRPYSTVEEMEEKIIANHNAIVGKDDTVYNLGDFCWKPADVPRIVSRLNGKQILITGNHDSCHPMHKNADKEKQKYLDAGFAEVHHQIELDEFVLNHFPYEQVDFEDNRFDSWRAKNQGKWLICGHVHQSFKIKNNMINVGVDVWDYKPVSIEKVREAIEHHKILHR